MNSAPQQLAQLGQFRPPVTNQYTQGAAAGTQSLTNLEIIISNSIGLLTIVAGMFFIIQFLLGAFSWITSGGDSGKLQSSRNRITNSIIGLVLIIAAYGIIGLIGRVVGLDLLRPGQMLLGIIP